MTPGGGGPFKRYLFNVVKYGKCLGYKPGKHMHTVNSNSCFIPLYFSTETYIWPLDGNAIKQFSKQGC